MSDPKVRGRFVWHELLTTDITAAADFYSRVVGWQARVWAENPSYSLFVAEGGNMAGLMVLPEEAKLMGAPPDWLTYIGTPNVDETAQHAAELGGIVLTGPQDIPGVGRFAVIRDPQGAVFAAFAPMEGPPGDGRPTLGDFSWHELATSDWRAALEFYQRLFGWEATDSMDMGPEMGTYQLFGWNGMTFGGMFNMPAQMPAPPHWLPYAMVRDVKAAAEIVARLGGRVIHGPVEVPGGDWIAQGLDPQGVLFAVHSPKTAALVPAAAKPEGMKVRAKKPLAEKPAAKKSADMKPAAKKPAAKKPTAKAPGAKKSISRGAVSKTKAASKPMVKKAGSKKVAVKKSAAMKPARTTATVKKAMAKKTATKKATAKKTATKKATAKKTATKKATAKKAVTKKAVTKKATARKTAAKKTAVKKTSAKKTSAKKAPAKKRAGKKAATKKTTRHATLR